MLLQIFINGIRGENYEGDIAIDDVILRSGSCGNYHYTKLTKIIHVAHNEILNEYVYNE